MIHDLEQAAENLNRALRPLVPNGTLDVVAMHPFEDDKMREIRVRYTSPASGYMAVTLESPDMELPIRTLSVRQTATTDGMKVPSKKGPAEAVLAFVVDWFQQNGPILDSGAKPSTPKDLTEYLRKRIPSTLAPEFQPGHQTLTVVLGPMVFVIKEWDQGRRFDMPRAQGGNFPEHLQIQGKGSLKFRGSRGSVAAVADHLLEWIKRNLGVLQKTGSLPRIVAMHRRLATSKALLLPRKDYEKFSKALVAGGIFEEPDYDTDVEPMPGFVLITDGMGTWRASGDTPKPILNILTKKQIDKALDAAWGAGWQPDPQTLYELAKLFFKGSPVIAEGEKRAKEFLKTTEGKAFLARVFT